MHARLVSHIYHILAQQFLTLLDKMRGEKAMKLALIGNLRSLVFPNENSDKSWSIAG